MPARRHGKLPSEDGRRHLQLFDMQPTVPTVPSLERSLEPSRLASIRGRRRSGFEAEREAQRVAAEAPPLSFRGLAVLATSCGPRKARTARTAPGSE